MYKRFLPVFLSNATMLYFWHITVKFLYQSESMILHF